MLLVLLTTVGTGAAWYHLCGPFVVPNVSIYLIMYVVTLVVAMYRSIKFGSTLRVYTALWIFVGFIIYVFLWGSTKSILAASILYLVLATPIIVYGKHVWQYVIGGILIVEAMAGAFTYLGILDVFADRPDQFAAFTYPDIIATAGHATNVILGTLPRSVSPMDGTVFRRYSMGVSSRLRYFSRLYTRSKVTSHKEEEP